MISNIRENTFIRFWDQVSEGLCSEIINDFHSRDCFPGISGNNLVNPFIKQSCDVPLTIDSCSDMHKELLSEVSFCLEQYLNEFPEANNVQKFGIVEPFNIQHYRPGEAFWVSHFERSDVASGSRHLAWMVFLNNVTDHGGTYFKYQNKMISAKAGRVVIWPTDWTHAHMGIVSPTQNKYIATGWYSYMNE